MAYMRGDYCIFCDGTDFNFHGPSGSVSIPVEVMDEFVVMRYARMSQEERILTEQRACVEHEGEFGADALRKRYGLPTVFDQMKAVSHGVETDDD